MHRSLPALLVALLVVTSAVAVADTGAPSPPQAPDDGTDPAALTPAEGVSPNTTRVLQLDSIETADFQHGDFSVTNTIQAQTARTETTMTLYSAETALESAEQDGQEQVLQNLTAQLDARIDRLEARERASRQQYIEGEITARQYLTVLGEVNLEASHLEGVLGQVERLAARNSAIENEVDRQQTEVVKLTGPVKDRVGDAVRGDGQTGRIFVAVSGQGVVLAVMDDGMYVRETVRMDARDDTSGGVNLDAAQTRIAELYPWAWDNNGGVSIRSIGQDVFRFQLSHDHGTLDSLLDTSSTNVYREIQMKSLDGLPTRPAYASTRNNTTVRVSSSYAGGPLKVTVENETGAPIQGANVRVNGTDIGRTDDDGAAWAISPAQTFNVTVEHEQREMDLQVVPR